MSLVYTCKKCETEFVLKADATLKANDRLCPVCGETKELERLRNTLMAWQKFCETALGLRLKLRHAPANATTEKQAADKIPR